MFIIRNCYIILRPFYSKLKPSNFNIHPLRFSKKNVQHVEFYLHLDSKYDTFVFISES